MQQENAFFRQRSGTFAENNDEQKTMMNIFCDWKINKGNLKGKIIMLAFRTAHIASYNKIFFIVMTPYLLFYRIVVEWLLGCEIRYKTKIGRQCALYHAQALVINDTSILGNNVTLRHSTTIGTKILENGTVSQAPIIGNYVDIGSNVCIIGNVQIGNNVKIGAGTVITKDIPSNCIVVGNPQKIIKTF